MIKPIFLALTVALAPIALTACKSEPETLTFVEAQNAALLAAKAKAIETLPEFWEMYENPPEGTSAYSVKVGFGTSGGSLEHIWMNDIRRTPDRMTAAVGNEPADVPELRLGARVKILEADISDWQYMKDGKLYGHYTTRTMLNTMNAEQRQQVEALLSDAP